jgi:NADPH:quinone reductase-like Zn-dependent oxidoreductase
MKAAIYTTYGSADVLTLEEVKKPSFADGEVLVQIHAASVTAADTMMRRGSPYLGRLMLGLRRPKQQILGTGFAGVIAAVGANVSLFKPGDRVFGETVFGFGTYAEFTVLKEQDLILSMPENTSFDEAASICDGPLTDMNFLRNLANIQPGQRILINGASGSLGTAAVQLAAHFSAHVTGVCSTANMDMVRDLGAHQVIDYTQVDFTQTGQRFDIVYDTVGKSSFAQSKRILTPDGVYLSPVLSCALLFQMLRTSVFGRKKAKFSATGMLPVADLHKMLVDLRGMLAAGHLISVVDRRYKLAQIAEAHRYVDTGHKRGNVVIAPACAA